MTNPNCRVLIFSILRFISTKCCKTQNPIVETIKTIIQLKGNGTPDVNVFKNIKQNNFNITD